MGYTASFFALALALDFIIGFVLGEWKCRRDRRDGT
jgi:hypothetical protein